jgi:hypothetical protein
MNNSNIIAMSVVTKSNDTNKNHNECAVQSSLLCIWMLALSSLLVEAHCEARITVTDLSGGGESPLNGTEYENFCFVRF